MEFMYIMGVGLMLAAVFAIKEMMNPSSAAGEKGEGKSEDKAAADMDAEAVTADKAPARAARPSQPSEFTQWGWMMFVLGWLGEGGTYFLFSTANGDLNNFGLMNDREVMMVAFASCLVAGAVFLAAGGIVNAVRGVRD